MNIIQLEFYTPQEKEPPIDTELLIQYDNNSYDVVTITNDSEYGKVIVTYESYLNISVIVKYAIIPIV